MLGRTVDARWDGRDPAAVWDGLLDRLGGLDGLVLNLECCLSTRGQPRPGRTFHFRADPSWAVPALSAAGVSAVSLANNHVLDFGPTAFGDTLAALDEGELAAAGAGLDRERAFAPAVAEAGDLTVAVVGLTDRFPGYTAGPATPGTAFVRMDRHDPLTRRWVGEALRRARQTDPDLVVASLHWGPNWAVRPAESQRSFARWLVDHGVDVVHGHSAHVVQGVEVYRGRPILYDCGDFVDDYVVKEGLHNDRSFLFELVVEGGRPTALRLRPVEIDGEAVHPAGSEAAGWLRDRIRSLSTPFGTSIERAGSGVRVPLACEG